MAQLTNRWVMAVDVGQSKDYTALVILQSLRIREKDDSDPFAKATETRRHDLIHAERFNQMPYPEQIERVLERYQELRRISEREHDSAPTHLVVDATGVGKPILDSFREAGARPEGIIITGGDATTKGDGVTRVPKRELATTLQVAIQGGRLKIAAELPLAETLRKEFLGFKVKISLSGHARFGNDVGEWRRGDAKHDDLVLATAMGVWHLEKRRTGIPDRETLRRAYHGI